jgi:hypothetical protein
MMFNRRVYRQDFPAHPSKDIAGRTPLWDQPRPVSMLMLMTDDLQLQTRGAKK